VVVSRSGTFGRNIYEIKLLAESIKNIMMMSVIVTHVDKEGEVESRRHNGPERR
jgi:hypothetical protein